jgi:hypothetical protein
MVHLLLDVSNEDIQVKLGNLLFYLKNQISGHANTYVFGVFEHIDVQHANSDRSCSQA